MHAEAGGTFMLPFNKNEFRVIDYFRGLLFLANFMAAATE